MTQLDVLYRFTGTPGENVALAIAKLRDVYGIRRLDVREREQTVRLEYDASRLTEPVIRNMLRRTGLEIVEQIELSKAPEIGEKAPETVAK